MSLEPFERRGLGETFFEWRIVGGGDVDGPSGMVLAVARGGDEAKDVGPVETAGKFLTDDFALSGHAAKAGNGD